ncbi:MAG: PAS domain-containing protein, partial [Gemmatimonadetes bacterium]|nr:PAS domain-containing protein [Gemmatimonadota bacterium]
ALESAADAFLITDEAGRIVFANAAFKNSFGADAAPGASFELGELFLNPGVAATMKENVETLGTFSCEVPMVARGGEEFHALVRATAIGGEPFPAIGGASDTRLPVNIAQPTCPARGIHDVASA